MKKIDSAVSVLVAFVFVLLSTACLKTSSDVVKTPDGTEIYSDVDTGLNHTRTQTVGYGGYGYGAMNGAYRMNGVRGGYSYDPRMAMPGWVNAPTPAYPSLECYDYWGPDGKTYLGTTCENDGVIAYVRDGRTFAPGETPSGEESALLRDTAAQTQIIVDYLRCKKTAGCRTERGGK